jgi:hypothetical protein
MPLKPPPAGVVHVPIPFRKCVEVPSPTMAPLILSVVLAFDVAKVRRIPFAGATGVVLLKFTVSPAVSPTPRTCKVLPLPPLQPDWQLTIKLPEESKGNPPLVMILAVPPPAFM